MTTSERCFFADLLPCFFVIDLIYNKLHSDQEHHSDFTKQAQLPFFSWSKDKARMTNKQNKIALVTIPGYCISFSVIL